MREASCSCGAVRVRCAGEPGRIAVTLGAFADPAFPPPRFSVDEERKHAWVAFGESQPIERDW